jgi:hypothetical protein
LEKLLANRSPENDPRIASSLHYLAYNYDRSVVERFTGELDLEKNPSQWDIEQAAQKKLNLPKISYDGSIKVEFDWPKERPLPIEGYRLIHGIRCGIVPLGETSSGEKLEIRHGFAELAVFAGTKKLHAFDLPTINPKTAVAAPTPPSFPWSFEGREFLLIILEAQWEKPAADARKLTRADVIVLEK